ncbi:hypothetical protein AMS68_004903 [Peltaster fructicola]|uniref:Spindle pole body component n=1 Tax=Peltaster fructicola TaxID=286661 RepID=A0A6H0XXH7_9PEZI|nr:hypothetical protein AMS68_004903 [Peltaster fructicola]
MLHEILLALAGHPSPLLEGKQNAIPGLALSASERQLLSTIDTLSRLHRQLKQHLDTIVKKHQSMICRAVATSLQQTHLERFQLKILDVEASILRKDSSTVGAYDIVPLAYIVAQFDEWQRRMAWYYELATFILPVDHEHAACSGAALIDRLRIDAQTGFPDIEQAAIELSRVAELSWLKQLASWLTNGTINPHGKDDFFVQREKNSEDQLIFRQCRDLLPKFVSNATATSMLFIGRSLQQLLQSQAGFDGRASGRIKTDIVIGTHMKLLRELTLPVVAAQLNHTIAAMRISLSRNVLQDLLPIRTMHVALEALRRYFLLSDSDFATCLIAEAERRLESRWRNMDRLAQMDPLKALQGLSIKDTETGQVLRQTWKVMASTAQQDIEDDVLEFAEKHISLTISKKAPSRPATADSAADVRLQLSPVAFNDLLFSTPTTLSLQIKAPLDLFLSAFDVGIYTHINAYLLSLRRAQQRLEDLWRRNPTKRSSAGAMREHNSSLRKVWASCSAALLLLSEMSAYLIATVTNPSFKHYQDWTGQHELQPVGNTEANGEKDEEKVQKDPETLAAGHRAFLDCLAYALLLTDLGYTKAIRSLLGVVEQVTSVFVRFLDARAKDGSISVQTDAQLSEQDKLQGELNKACLKLDTERRNVVARLRDLHQQRVGPDRYLATSKRYTGGYEPLKVGGLDHLLMKLEYEQTSDGNVE